MENLLAGLYFITISDANGCIVIDSIELTEPSLPSSLIQNTILNGSDIRCYNGIDGIASVNIVNGGTPPFKYL